MACLAEIMVFVWWNKPWLAFQALFIFLQSNGSIKKLWSLGDMFIQTKQLSECKIYLLFTSKRNTLWVSLSQVTLQFIVTYYDFGWRPQWATYKLLHRKIHGHHLIWPFPQVVLHLEADDISQHHVACDMIIWVAVYCKDPNFVYQVSWCDKQSKKLAFNWKSLQVMR